MLPRRLPDSHPAVAKPLIRSTTVIWAVYAVLGIVLAAYLTALILRPEDETWPLIDGWGVAGFEVVISTLCVLRALGSQRHRVIPLTLGAGLFCWAMGDSVLTFLSRGGAAPSSPSLADVFYLGFYPFVYVAVLLLLRREIRKLIPATWLDGAVAGLGAAALFACFAFNAILQSAGGDAAAVATNLAYPTGDLLLLALAVGGTAVLQGRRRAPWLLLAVGCAVNSVGDTFNLFGSAGGMPRVGHIIDTVAWPTATLLMSMSVWLRPSRPDLLTPQKAAGFLLPGLGAVSGLAVLVVGTRHQVSDVALALAAATLVTVGVRLWLSVGSLRALTEIRHRQSVTDDLTGLGNRRLLFQILDGFFDDHANTGTPERSLSFLFIDLNHFKEINDSFGHGVGDELLKQLGPRLRADLRSSDLLVRIGGDELGVVMMDSDPRYAATLAQRLLTNLEQPFVLEGVNVRISASIGIACAPDDAMEVVGLLRCADLAMYRAKLSKSSVEVYSQELDDGGSRLRLVDELREAVEGGHFVLHYQPQVDLRTGDIAAVEALLRWPHPRLGFVPPLEFVPLAEEAGLMQRLTELVLDQALAQADAWRTEGHDLAMSVNVSASNLLDADFFDMVSRRLAEHHVPPSSLILEITETTIIGDFEGCKRVIARLRELGVGISIDDFGAGFTSLAYLAGLAVTELKLDRTFILDVIAEDRGRDLALVEATIALGHALGLRVVAEGVEDRAMLTLLARIGCDLAQGYYISRPMPASEVDLSGGFAGAEKSSGFLRAS